MTSIARSVLVASCLILSSLPSLCQEEPVVLTATGYGQSIDEAITSSVRSALEQTFGVFLSSDTRTNISEDATSQTMEVIDEIATLSKGNIVEYEVISSSLLESGEAVATTRCTIALEPMKGFVNAKGHHAEFSGGLFGRTLKLRELNILAEEQAMQDLVDQTRLMLAQAVDFEISPSEPRQSNAEWILPIVIESRWNDNLLIWREHFLSTAEEIAMGKDEVKDFKSNGQNIFAISIANGALVKKPKFKKLHFRNPRSLAHLLDVMHVIGQSLLNFTIDAGVFELEGSDCWEMVMDDCRSYKELKAGYISGFLGVAVSSNYQKCYEWSFPLQILDCNRPDDLSKYSILGESFYTGNGTTTYGADTKGSAASSISKIGSTHFLTGTYQSRPLRNEEHMSILRCIPGCDPSRTTYGTVDPNEIPSNYYWNLGHLTRSSSPDNDFQLALQITPSLKSSDLEQIQEIAIKPSDLLKLR